MIFLLFITMLVLFYWFIVLPKQVQKHVYYRKGKPFEISYHADLQNIKNCISKADNVDALNMCYIATQHFKRRNKYLKKHGFRVDLKGDIEDLYQLIRNKHRIIIKSRLN